MSKYKNINYIEIRKYVSKLYIAVLTQRITVREALINFPKECEDKTIIAAWHALCHLEADEEIRKKDKMYAKEQDEYIEYIAFTLNKGDSLPSNIIESYFPYYNSSLTPTDNSIKGIFYSLKRFLCC